MPKCRSEIARMVMLLHWKQKISWDLKKSLKKNILSLHLSLSKAVLGKFCTIVHTLA